jgi:hypothetical protein
LLSFGQPNDVIPCCATRIGMVDITGHAATNAPDSNA